MGESKTAYNGEFTIEERKALTAQTMKELRKGKRLLQKEVAAYLKIPTATYNTYESGRTEPPIEILVRLSYFYDVSIDIIVQRDRAFRTADDLNRQMEACKTQIDEIKTKAAEQVEGNSDLQSLLAAMEKLADVITGYSQSDEGKNALNSGNQ